MSGTVTSNQPFGMQSFVAVTCALALALAPLSARGEEVAGSLEAGPEKTAEACQDGADNDGDGKTDCRDTDCHAFAFCSELAAPPRHWKAPLIAGAVLIPVAFVLAFSSIPLWFDALDKDHPALNQHFSGKDGIAIGGAAALTALSLAAAATSAVLLTRGINRRNKMLKNAQLMISPLGVGGKF